MRDLAETENEFGLPGFAIPQAGETILQKGMLEHRQILHAVTFDRFAAGANSLSAVL
jgi:hypothetical protein